MNSLFENHQWRALSLIVALGGVAHYAAGKLPLSYYAPASMAVALFASTSVIILSVRPRSGSEEGPLQETFLRRIVARYRNRYQDRRTQTQDEVLLIATFGLWWFCILLAIRWYYATRGSGGQLPSSANTAVATAHSVASAMKTITLRTTTTTRRLVRPTQPVRYVVEEWLF